MKAIYRKRLLNVAKALRESKEPEKFTMEAFGHACGAPACALGHYAARRDLQRAFDLVTCSWNSKITKRGKQRRVLSYGLEVQEHFGISDLEAEELFYDTGCNRAQTAIKAARYIERFVARKVRP